MKALSFAVVMQRNMCLNMLSLLQTNKGILNIESQGACKENIRTQKSTSVITLVSENHVFRPRFNFERL